MASVAGGVARRRRTTRRNVGRREEEREEKRVLRGLPEGGLEERGEEEMVESPGETWDAVNRRCLIEVVFGVGDEDDADDDDEEVE